MRPSKKSTSKPAGSASSESAEQQQRLCAVESHTGARKKALLRVLVDGLPHPFVSLLRAVSCLIETGDAARRYDRSTTGPRKQELADRSIRGRKIITRHALRDLCRSGLVEQLGTVGKADEAYRLRDPKRLPVRWTPPPPGSRQSLLLEAAVLSLRRHLNEAVTTPPLKDMADGPPTSAEVDDLMRRLKAGRKRK